MNRLKMNPSVLALCDLPEGVCSLPGVGDIDLRRLLEKPSTKVYFHVDMCNGCLCLTEKQVGQSWARFVAVARNCHEQNVELTKSEEGFILRMTRTVKASQELFVWIGTDLLSVLAFPFLNPANIKGNQAYHCHKCGQIFQDPNPLKVHLSFQCQAQQFKGQSLKTSLEGELRSIEKPYGNISKFSTKHDISAPLLFVPNSSTKYEMLPVGLNLSTHPTHHGMKPVQGQTTSRKFCKNLNFELRISHDSRSSFPSSSSSLWFDHSSGCSLPNPGHICSYCGKVYSRKYGLKIHVRTHTGYKPLKCRYCLRPFSDPSNLNKHVRLHSESDTPYRCTICGKVLVRRRDLLRHLKSRHQDVSPG